jgi:hypothetical protein
MAWDEASETHVARHAVTPDEVENDMADVAAEPMVVTSIRLPRPLMQRVRAQADAAGVPATALIRGWVEDRLVAQETGDIGQDQLVAALRAVLADLDPLRAHLADPA